jgi:hypothetical protein
MRKRKIRGLIEGELGKIDGVLAKINNLERQVRCGAGGHRFTCSGNNYYECIGFVCTLCGLTYEREKGEFTPAEKKCYDSCFS